MTQRRLFSVLALLAALGPAACGGEDVPLGEPAGMGAGRPDTSGAESGVLGEVDPDATEILESLPPAVVPSDTAANSAGGS